MMERHQPGLRRAAGRTRGADVATAATGRPTGRGGIRQGVATLVVSLGVAGAAASGIVSIQDDAERAREAQFVLASLNADTFRALHLQARAIHDDAFEPGLDQELGTTLRAGASKAAGLDGLEGHTHHLGADFIEFQRGIEDVILALRAGDHDEAHRLETARTEPAVGRLSEAIDRDLVEQEREAERAEQLAYVGSIVALVLAALLISGLTGLHRRFRRRAERFAAEQGALLLGERRFRSLVQHSSDMISILDADLVPSYNSPSVARVLGYRDDEMGTTASGADLVHPDEEVGVRARLKELVAEAQGNSALLAYRIKHRDGSWRHVETVATNLLGEPAIAGLVLNSRDVTERAALQGQLTYRALHDPLTDLPNRTLFQDRAQHALDRAARNSDHTAVALLDLDNFKTINDSFGHAAGDDLLMTVAERLNNCTRPGDTVARLDGDEFAVLLEDTVGIESLGMADRMLQALRQPVVMAGRPIVINASIGVATSREASDAPTLIRNADLAMYSAKEQGKARTEIFHQGMHEAIQVRLQLEADLRLALEDALVSGQLRLHYQPKVSLTDGRITGLEALVRWQHPRRGLVPPAEFITLAEETGLVVPLGSWVLEEACRQAAAWQAQLDSHKPLTMAVNVSARQFESDFVGIVARILATTKLEPCTLCLEVTESVVMKDVDTATSTLRNLKALGVQLSIDDFGTGYSSLSYLKQFPLDELKIDKSFVDGLGQDTDDGALVAAIMGMARALELSVVAEGVETEGQAMSLAALGCETAQGFYFSRPKAAAEITELLVADRLRRPQNATSTGRPSHAPAIPARRRPIRPGFA